MLELSTIDFFLFQMELLNLLPLLLILGASEGQWASIFYQNVERQFDVERGLTFHNGHSSSFHRQAARGLTAEPETRANQRTGYPNQSYQHSVQTEFTDERQTLPMGSVIGFGTARNSHQPPHPILFSR